MSGSRVTTNLFSIMYLSPLTSEVYQCYMLPSFFIRLLSYLVGIKRRTNRHVACKRDNSHFLCYVLISPEAEILCGP